MFEPLVNWLQTYAIHLSLTAITLSSYLTFRVILGPVIRKHAHIAGLKPDAVAKALHVLNILTAIAVIATLLIVWGFDFRGLLTLSASLLAVTGVALFAGWSVLSNVTAFFILLAHSSFKRGNFVRVIDGDNYIEGYISEINLFSTRMISEGREVVIYPNNLLLSRPMIVNPKLKLDTVGKVNEKPKAKHGATTKAALKKPLPKSES